MFMGQRRPNFCPNSVQFVPSAVTMGSHSLFNGSARAQIGPLWGFWEKVGTTPPGWGIEGVGEAKNFLDSGIRIVKRSIGLFATGDESELRLSASP